VVSASDEGDTAVVGFTPKSVANFVRLNSLLQMSVSCDWFSAISITCGRPDSLATWTAQFGDTLP